MADSTKKISSSSQSLVSISVRPVSYTHLDVYKRQEQLKEIQAQLDQSPSGQISLTDPDARAMATSTSRGLVGYNVQTAVDTRHHLIVAHEVTNIGSDRRQLAKMARQAKVAMATPDFQVIADRGYYHGEGIHAREEAVSFTHLDAYNRQLPDCVLQTGG